MDWLVPFLEFAKRLVFVVAPHAGGDVPRYTALCPHRIAEVVAPIGTILKNRAGIIGQCIWTSPTIIDVDGRDGDFFDQRCVGICTDLSLEAEDSRFFFVFNVAASPA